VVLKLRRTDFKIVTRRITLPEPIQTARALFAAGRDLLGPELGRPYRLIGIGMGEVVDAVDAPPPVRNHRKPRPEDRDHHRRLRAKFGKDAVVAGRALKR
jgi:DNA polymerase-4